MASSSSSGCWKYDVFLSFRGEDTRKTFVDHLYSALQQHGILTYKDDITLDRGNTIGPALLKAIEESQIALVIFSENYADSSWCLDELSHIMKGMESERGQLVMPIFYHVDPSDVRKQKRKYGEAFAKHELLEKGNNKVETWKKALSDASNIAGWEPKHVANGHEAQCIKEIVGSILDKLSSLDSTVEDENLVGMETRLEDLKQLLRIGSGGVRMVGIWGLGGGGKTTLATSLYMKFSPNFDSCCFLGNIREETKQHGLQSLQEKVLLAVGTKMQVQSADIGKHTIKRMLCRRNVLIVLDDVDRLEQLEALAGSHNWFGNGSRIIITTRDEQVLKSHRVDEVCPISLLSHDEAIRLFKRHAYQDHNPVEEYEKLSLHVISYVNGLPLALKILGAFLYGKDKDEWISTLARLKDHPEMDIVEKLKISYDGLKPVEKELFLDIACFHRWDSKDGAMEMLDAFGFHPRIGVKVLIQKALITVSKEGMFDMHDLVQEMAHYIVRGEHPNNPEKHSRVWRKEDIEEICSRNATSENDKIEAIRYSANVCSSKFMILVSNMNKLRFLKVETWPDYDEGPGFLSNELRYIEWADYYPATPFPESFEPRKLVVLRMEGSLQKELWKGCKYLPCLKELELRGMRDLVRTPDFGGLPCLQKLILDRCDSLEEIHESLGNHYLPCLKELQLSYMNALVRTPDFGGLPCLQKLILARCPCLEEIHQSVGNHKSLVLVEVDECEKLRRFPSIVGMEKLEILRISRCKALVEFTKIEAKMDNLDSEDDLCMHQYLSCLKELELRGMRDLVRTPDFGGLPCLQKLILEGCHSLEEIHPSLGNHYLPCLKELQLSYMNALVRTPDFGGLPCLQKLKLFECGSLEEIHQSLGNHKSLVSVDVSLCEKLTRFPSIVGMEKLEILYILCCPALAEFPIRIEAKMDNLVGLSLNSVGIEVLPSSVGEYCTNLISLQLSWCGKLKSIEGNFQALRKLDLSGCGKLKSIEGNFQALRKLDLSRCGKLKIEGNFQALRKLDLSECGLKDGEIPNEIGELSNLQELHLDHNDFTRLDFSLSRLTRLKLLDLNCCGNLVELPELPSSLAILKADHCWSLKAVIRDEIHTNCKWLSRVSIRGWEVRNKIGGERLLETMIQGNAVESRCMSLQVQGLEIARGFEPRLVRGSRCGMQLPSNWFNHFSGFLFCAASYDDYSEHGFSGFLFCTAMFSGETVMISMKHEEEKNGGLEDCQHDDLYWEEESSGVVDKRKSTWVGYIPFSLLRHTSWWDPTSTAIHIQFDLIRIFGCGLKLVPKRGGAERSGTLLGQMETTPDSSSSFEISDDDDDDYKCKFKIQHDSKSALTCGFHCIYLQ